MQQKLYPVLGGKRFGFRPKHCLGCFIGFRQTANKYKAAVPAGRSCSGTDAGRSPGCDASPQRGGPISRLWPGKPLADEIWSLWPLDRPQLFWVQAQIT
jgi:hypothetical protein